MHALFIKIRELKAQQDEEYESSLSADIAKVIIYIYIYIYI